MTFSKSILTSAFLVLSTPAWACEPPAVFYDLFTPNAGQADAADLIALVHQTAPLVREVYLARGVAAEQSMCGGQGYLTIELAIPSGAVFDFSDVGFEFKTVSGYLPDVILPKGPMKSVLGAEMTFQMTGHWFEGPPSQHKTINALVEVSFVAPDGTRGPVTQIELVSIPKPASGDEGDTR